MIDSKIRSDAAGSFPPACGGVVVTAVVLWLLDIETLWGDLCSPAKPVVIKNASFCEEG